MLRTIQILSIIMGAISLFFLASHWLDVGPVGALLQLQVAYEKALHLAFGWAEPYAAAVARFIGIELPVRWKDAVALYVTMAGATVRSSRFLLGFFSQAIAEADRHLRELLRQRREMEYGHQVEVREIMQSDHSGEERDRLTREAHDRHRERVEEWENEMHTAERALREALNSGRLVTGLGNAVLLLAALLWPIVWLLDLLTSQRPGMGWFRRLRTSFVGMSMYEFSKIVAGALIFFAINAYPPEIFT